MKVVLTWMLYSVLLCVYTHAESVTQDLVDDDDFKSLLSGGETNSSLTHQDVTNISTIVTNSSIFSNITHRGFIHGFGESISVILVSEIGDKTFFIAAILAMRNNKLTVFLAAVSALFLMTVLSGLLGWVVTTFIPREVTYYTCTAIMFLFGFKMLWEAWKMDENEAEEVQREVEQELARRGSIASVHSRRDVEAAANRHAHTSDNQTSSNRQTQDSRNDQTIDQTTRSEDANKTSANEVQGAQNQAFEDNENRNDAPSSTPAVIDTSPMENEATAPDAAVGDNNDAAANDSSSTAVTRAKTNKNHVSFLGNVIDRSCKENSWFGKKCLKMFKLFINTFTMTFIAEWGDRSQLATIVLVGINDVAGVILGGCIGHFICTGGAVLAGALIAKYVSVRKVTFIGALVFLGFAIASIFISPQEDGIEGIPEINGYDNATRMINHNVSLTLALQHIKEEGGKAMFENVLEYNDY